MKYLKHYLPAFTAIIYFITISLGEYYPTIFLIGFSLFIIIGDHVLPRDKEIQEFSHASILNFSMYINLPILFVLILLIITILSNNLSLWYIEALKSNHYYDFIHINNSINIIDKISIIFQTSLFI